MGYTPVAFIIGGSMMFNTKPEGRYALAEDYIGQTVTPVLVLEVETAGMWDSVARVKF